MKSVQIIAVPHSAILKTAAKQSDIVIVVVAKIYICHWDLEHLAQAAPYENISGCLDLRLPHLPHTLHLHFLQLQCHHQDRLPQAIEGENPPEQQKRTGAHFWLTMAQMKGMNQMASCDTSVHRYNSPF
jgi:hypothetical protein